jgi:hypothetical protein
MNPDLVLLDIAMLPVSATPVLILLSLDLL